MTIERQRSPADQHFINLRGGGGGQKLSGDSQHSLRDAQVGTAAVAAWDPVPSGPRRERIILVKELTQKGFVIFNHVSRFEEAIRELVQLLDSEGLCFREDIRDGLDAGPQALVDLYSGSNTGKALIRLAGK